MLSILTPAFNEADNLNALYARLVDATAGLGLEWEWVVVDDHSSDATFEVLERLAAADRRVRGIRLARNSGSHLAIACGLAHVRGAAAVMMSADLQDPPETVAAMVAAWRQGAEVVWAVRRQHPGRPWDAGFSEIYYWIMRSVVGLRELPHGSDCFLVDRVVIDAFNRSRERRVNVFALVASLGFRQVHVEYDKQPRAAGRSGWTLARKIDLVADSVTAFSNRPLRYVGAAGAVLAALGLAVSAAGLIGLARGGAGLTLVLGLLIGLAGVQLAALGLVGEYVWRTLEESRRRPAWVVERTVGEPGPGEAPF